MEINENKIEDYKKTNVYKMFHTYIPTQKDDSDLLTIKKIKSEEPTHENTVKETNTLDDSNDNKENQTHKISVTDKTPQNPLLSSNKPQTYSVSVKIPQTKESQSPKVAEQTKPQENTETVKPQVTKVLETNKPVKPAKIEEPDKTVENLQPQPVSDIVGQQNMQQPKLQLPTTVIDSTHEERKEQSATISPTSDATLPNKPEQVEPTSQVAPNTQIKQPENLLDTVLDMSTAPVQDPNQNKKELIYQEVQKAAQDVKWIKQSHAFEFAFKNDLAKLPLNKLSLFSIDDNSEAYIPLNTILLNHLGSVVIGKELYILLLFRDGKIIQIAPKSWLSQKDNLKNNGFNYYYDKLDMTKLLTTLKKLSASITPSDKFTEFWLKYAPIIQK